MSRYSVVVLEGAYASSVAISIDVLRAARRLAPRLELDPPTWQVCSVDGGPVNLQGGLSVQTTRLSTNQADTWILPGMGTDTPTAVQDRLARPDAIELAGEIARHVAGGGTVAASCSAVFLLGAAGVLDGHRVTATWWLAPFLASQVPACTVDADRMVCADGQLITAGAALAHTDLMLHLLRTGLGSELTAAVARSLLIDARQAQSPYVVPEILANGAELVTRVVHEIERSLPHPPSVAELAAEFAMSERTLARQITRATGRSTLALVQSVKLRRARTLLETTGLSVDQIAVSVGYADATALRRSMKKVIGANPSQYRAR